MLAIVVALAIAAAIQPAEPEEEAFLVEDPFAIEDEQPDTAPSAEVAAAAAPTPAAGPSRDALICRSRPELNTRTRWLRVCMTAEQWANHETNMEQQRRDINDWGAQGGLGPE